MNTITVQYNPKNEIAIGLIGVLSKIRGVRIKNSAALVKEEEYPYNPDFVEEILQSDRSEGVKIKREDLWK